MIAVSSCRPLSQCSPAILKNQLRARESWEDAFERIAYFGPRQKALDGPLVTFVDSEPFPRILDLARYAAKQPKWCAIVNADIVVSPYLIRVEYKMESKKATCAVSRRYEFSGENIGSARVVDMGLDFFAATPGVWQNVARNIPSAYRLGSQKWDTWMLGFFASTQIKGFADLTPHKLIFHPRHEDRRYQPVDDRHGDRYAHAAHWPVLRI